MELESDTYDVVVIGTGLAESIAAASLAKIGKTVLHIDPNEYYGAEQASLTLDELITWTAARSTTVNPDSTSIASSSRSPYLSSQTRKYTQASTTPLTPALEADKRRYALSLFPSILPSRGPLISTLIASDVSKYVSFRILDSVGIWDPEDGEEGRGGIRKVPGSKEEVFKDKSIGLLDKRRLMKFLMFAAGDFETDPIMNDIAEKPLLQLLQETFLLPSNLAQSIAYAISHCNSPSDLALPALLRTRRYLRSIGRYGSSAFLIGQYGGAGEVAQAFCRACAVFAGTYILGASGQLESIESSMEATDESNIVGPLRLKLPCHPRPIFTKHLISSVDHLPSELAPSSSPSSVSTTAHCIAILSAIPEILKKSKAQPSSQLQEGDASSSDPTPMEIESEDDTAVIIFPPSDEKPVVRALLMGEGTGSCPVGQYILYLSTDIPDYNANSPNPREVLNEYLTRLATEPLFEAYYYSHRPISSTMSSSLLPSSTPGLVVLNPYAGSDLLTEGLDWEAEQGEAAFWEVLGGKEGVVADGEERRGFFEKTVEDEEPDEDEL